MPILRQPWQSCVRSILFGQSQVFSGSKETEMWRGLIEEFRDRLPVNENTPVITLHEGNTPLVPAPALSDRTGCDVYLKVEGANPTGSFKDRGMTGAVSTAVAHGAKARIC